MSALEYGLLLEALAHSPVMLSEVVPPRSVFFLGDERQRERWLPALLAGDMVSTAAITEPQAGSDLRAMSTRPNAALLATPFAAPRNGSSSAASPMP